MTDVTKMNKLNKMNEGESRDKIAAHQTAVNDRESRVKDTVRPRQCGQEWTEMVIIKTSTKIKTTALSTKIKTVKIMSPDCPKMRQLCLRLPSLACWSQQVKGQCY